MIFQNSINLLEISSEWCRDKLFFGSNSWFLDSWLIWQGYIKTKDFTFIQKAIFNEDTELRSTKKWIYIEISYIGRLLNFLINWIRRRFCWESRIFNDLRKITSKILIFSILSQNIDHIISFAKFASKRMTQIDQLKNKQPQNLGDQHLYPQ